MRRIFVIIAFALWGCNYNRFEPLAVPDDAPLIANWSIGRLKLGEVRSSTIVRGVVVTSDSAANFYKEFLITDPVQGATLAVRAGIYEIYTIYNRGAVVCVELQGAEVVSVEGLLTVSLASNLALVASRVRVEQPHYALPPISTTIEKLAELAAGSFVELADVYFQDAGFRTFSGEARLFDGTGDRWVVVYTSPYASFAKDALPMGRLTLRGILLFSGGKPRLKLV